MQKINFRRLLLVDFFKGNKGMSLLFCSQLISLIGDKIFMLAIAWWTVSVYGRASDLGYVMIAGSLPFALLGPVGGAICDRFDKKKILIITELVRGLAVALLTIVAFRGSLQLWHVIAVNAFISLNSALSTPAAMSSIPFLVKPDNLTRANSLFDFAFHLSSMIGPAMGGALMALMDIRIAFAVNAASFFVSGGLLYYVQWQKAPAGHNPESGHVFKMFADGLKYAYRNRLVAGMINFFSALNFFFVPIFVFLPLLVKNHYGKGAGEFGLLEMFLGIGMIVSAVILLTKGKIHRRGLWLWATVFLAGAFFMIMGLVPTYAAGLASLLAIGFCLGFANVVIMVVVQEKCDEAYLGRVMGILVSITSMLQPLSYAVYGRLGNVVAIPMLLMVNGAVIAAVSFALFKIKGYQELQ